jgi:hypothetical protein
MGNSIQCTVNCSTKFFASNGLCLNQPLLRSLGVNLLNPHSHELEGP